ncbi:MAG: cytochrome C [Bacteroidetes bacterium]|nr:cytochrome C [Bacteroidota bacterium]MBP7398693.1 cytochrome C [Chitinophagales bacterium]MBK7108950.1 cytochrome C [Bacteroidota bacterium]MBK8488725.1 cytochrome C [Bacteroidota bacterium]MBK8681518.1 cytochrome C [Bacteroidota bacterium]
MQDNKSRVTLFVDDDLQPIAELSTPVQFELDTRKLTDGEHTLKIVSKSPVGKEGIRKIKFIVRNGPAIAVDGISDNKIVDGVIPIMINAYDKGNQKKFIIEGSETPKSIPSWLWIILVAFLGWAAYFIITHFNM